jgi:hypothetical protein
MRSRIVRLGVLVVGLLGLLGVATPPAQARTIGTIVFDGTATLDGGLGYPCADATVDTSLPKCPQGVGNAGTPLVLTTKSLPLPTPAGAVELGQLPYIHGSLTRGFGFAADLCVDVMVNINKLGKAPAHAGPCAIGATGTVQGWCGLSTGLAAGTFTDALGQNWSFRIHFHGYGGQLIIRGHITKQTNTVGQTGLLVGVVNAAPPIATVTPGSCTNQTARDFQVTGSVAGVPTA